MPILVEMMRRSIVTSKDDKEFTRKSIKAPKCRHPNNKLSTQQTFQTTNHPHTKSLTQQIFQTTNHQDNKQTRRHKSRDMALALFQREIAESYKNKTKLFLFVTMCGDACTTKAADEERASPNRLYVSPMRSSFIGPVQLDLT